MERVRVVTVGVKSVGTEKVRVVRVRIKKVSMACREREGGNGEERAGAERQGQRG